jgi:hypothetical protein
VLRKHPALALLSPDELGRDLAINTHETSNFVDLDDEELEA